LQQIQRNQWKARVGTKPTSFFEAALELDRGRAVPKQVAVVGWT
jgi:hypothetical protein